MALTVVTGPPAAGKTTYVRQHAKQGDIVIDYDLIANALTVRASDTHQHPAGVRQVAHRARRAAIEEALQQAQTCNVWIVHSLPNADTRARYQEHGARIVTVDPGRDVVMARIRDQRHRTAIPVATRWYHTHTGNTEQPPARASRSW